MVLSCHASTIVKQMSKWPERILLDIFQMTTEVAQTEYVKDTNSDEKIGVLA